MTELRVRSWMNSTPCTIGPKDNLHRARALMRSAHVAELLVVDDNKLVGLLNEHDIWEHCPTSTLVLEAKAAEELLAQIRVGGVMTLHPPAVTPETTLREAVHLLADSKRHGLPVVENGTPVGFLAEERLWQAMVLVLTELDHYVTMKEKA